MRSGAGLWGVYGLDEEYAAPQFEAVVLLDGCCAAARKDGVGPFAAAALDGKYGYIDAEGPVLVPGVLDRAGDMEEGLLVPGCEANPTFFIPQLQFAALAVRFLEKTLGEPIVPAPEGAFSDTDDEAARKAYAAGIVRRAFTGSFTKK